MRGPSCCSTSRVSPPVMAAAPSSSGLDLTVHRGEAVALLGRNGVGKTTTLRALTGTVHVDTGTVSFDGVAAERPEAL